MLYPIARRALFQLPAERAHEVVIGGLSSLPRPARRLISAISTTRDPSLRTRAWGIDFRTPIGLAAGLDKSGTAFNALGALGFGFVEIGTITAHAQPGNPKPRLFRLPRDRALLNRMGFNNPGAEAVADRLATAPIEVVLGINIGKSKVTPLEGATEDYLRSISLLERFARYLVINVSSPNTPGLRELQDAQPLRNLLRAVIGEGGNRSARRVPVLLKLAPDLTDRQIDQAVEIATEEGIAGIVAVNTTVSREGLATSPDQIERLGAGGISGAPLRDRASEVVARIYRHVGGSMPIVGVGGIFTADDAWERIRAGASLIQIYTGFVYEGPAVVKRINEGIAMRLRASGYRTIGEAVGSAHR
jgi:dihydroorotate dehydrogenase